MVSVMCCGCGGLLGRDGQLVRPEGMKFGGIVQRDDLFNWSKCFTPAMQDAIANFADAKEANTAAIKAGWSVKEGGKDGDHRCPLCRHLEAALVEKTNDRAGAIVEFEKMFPERSC